MEENGQNSELDDSNQLLLNLSISETNEEFKEEASSSNKNKEETVESEDSTESPIKKKETVESNDSTESPIEEKETVESNDSTESPKQEKQIATSEIPTSESSPEPSCAICLGKLQNETSIDCCLHVFCFTCLLEWAKIKPECPLCKKSFESFGFRHSHMGMSK